MPIPGTDLLVVLDAPEHPVKDAAEGYGGLERRKLPAVEVINMADKPKVSSAGSPNGYPEADVPPLTPEQAAARRSIDLTNAAPQGTPGMGRDYRPTRDDPMRSVGLPDEAAR
jgi:hypothetical protein